MQFKAVLAAVAITASSVIAQDLSQLPQCASGPAFNALQSTGCGTDISCVCKNKSFLTSLQPVIVKACSPADLAKALAFAQSLCSSVGVSLDISSAAPATTAAPTVTSASVATTDATVSSKLPLGPGPELTSSTASAASTASTGSIASVTSASESAASAASASSAAASISTGAAVVNVGVDGGLGMVLGAVVAALAL